ncbi:MAG: nucleoside hydrolase [Clostridiaceae bacterium]|uniref:Nucleoside hydrolase n=1 Tax=Clostridium porci TaxID=2605778 RepID=A0A7X2TCA2_9CLOT|nr:MULTISPECIES: nucleoside hydrolase [Clostridium]MCI6140192.1 nucleoside hydrolase [Clostridium sp.]MDY3231799.1 nucleoside hydrolase [Clostridiaceae bacterium]MSS36340.1 nucleoside hydrolase [Clostridium porci]
MKKKIIMDIDSVGDDILAVLYMALNERAELLGITTVTGAAGDIQQAAWVARNTVELAKREISIYAGADHPISDMAPDNSGDPVNFYEELRWKFGDRLRMFNTPAKKPKGLIQKQHAVDYLIHAFNKEPGEITLITTGPLTNVALALQKDPSIGKKIKEAYVLGGAFKIYGNISPVTEYNISADPEAAKMVLNSDMKITLVPLDVCENNIFADGMLTRDHLSDMQYGGKGEVIDYIVNKFPIYIDMWREYFQLGGFPMDDVITAAIALDESLCRYTEELHVDVELGGRLTRGQTIAFVGYQINKYPEREHKNVRIACSVEGKRFMNHFIETIINGCR